MDIGAIWDLIILNPLINGMVWLSDVLFSSFGLTIIILTIVVRGLMYPLTMKQLHATRAMSELQPKLKEIQKKYAKDKERLAQEQMKLYRESGVSPTGCLLPMLVQMPIWIALYQSIIRVMAVTPEDFLNLSNRLYDWPVLYKVLPIDNQFLWLDLAKPDYILALLVGVTMWMQQKMVMQRSADPKQAAQGQMMQTMMPLMFIFLSISFPSGLAIYWVASAIITIVIQYFVTGWGGMQPWIDKLRGLIVRDTGVKKRIAEVEKEKAQIEMAAADIEKEEAAEADIIEEEVPSDERGGKERQERREGYRTSLRSTKRKSGRSKSKRHKRR